MTHSGKGPIGTTAAAPGRSNAPRTGTSRLLRAALLAAALTVPTAAAQAGECTSRYETVPGESVAGIAYKCGLSVSELIAANPYLAGRSGLRSGMVLTLPAPRQSSSWTQGYSGATAQTTQRSFQKRWSSHTETMPAQIWTPSERQAGPYYRVSYGDTLSGIAERHGVSVWDIMLLNPEIRNPHLLNAGADIRLPYGARSLPAPRTKAASFQAGQTVSAVPMPTPNGTVVSVYLKGFPANETVRIGLGPNTKETAIVGGGRVNERGELATEFTLPSAFSSLDRAVVTARALDSRVDRASDPFFLPLNDTGKSWSALAPTKSDDLPVGTRITVEGVITSEGESCAALRDKDGQLFTLTATDAKFEPGDIVRIKGIVAPYDWCGQGIAVATASAETRIGDGGSSGPVKTKAYRKTDSSYEVIRPASRDLRASSSSFEDLEVVRPFSALTRQQFVRGTVVSKDDRCTSVRGEDGVLYAVSAQLHNLRRGDRVELIGQALSRDPCGAGIGFEVEEARRYSKYGS